MAKQVIGIGTIANDGTGDPLRTAFNKCNSNFDEVYTGIERVYYSATANMQYYLPVGNYNQSSNSVSVADTIYIFPGYIKNTITIDQLAGRIASGAGTGGKCQFAVYAASTTTGRPTGNALVSTSDITATGTGAIVGTASLQLTPNMYWWATNNFNSSPVATFCCIAATGQSVGMVTGSQFISNVIGGGVATVAFSVSQAYNTWPDLTSASWSNVQSAVCPLIGFRVASVP